MPDGTTICAECMFEMMQEKTGDWKEDPAAVALVDRAKAELVSRTRVPAALFRVTCQYFDLPHDVEVNRNAAGIYVVKLYFELGTHQGRYRASIDYLVTFVADHPMPQMATQLDNYLRQPNSLSNDTCLIIFPIRLESQPRDDSFFESVLHSLLPEVKLPSTIQYLVWKPLFVEEGREMEIIQGEWNAWEAAQPARKKLRQKTGQVGSKAGSAEIGFLLGYCE